MFDSLDLNRLQSEDAEDQVCPYCAAELDPEDPVCRSCGMNVEAGVMDTKEARKRAIKGPDPDLFFKETWKDCWNFIFEYKVLCFRTGSYWLLFFTTMCFCAYMVTFCKNFPTKAFWAGLSVIAFLGLPGWFVFLGGKLVQATINREQIRPDRIFFDYFQAVAGGIRLVFWPLVVMGPFTPAMSGVLGYFSTQTTPLVTGIIAGVTWGLIPLLLLPIAFVHMQAKYTYKAWILWELLKIGAKNAGAVFFLYLVAIVAVLPMLTAALPIWLLSKDGNPWRDGPVFTWFQSIGIWLMKAMDLNADPEGWMVAGATASMTSVTVVVIAIPFFLLSGFIGVYIMRAIGLFGYYNNHYLDLVQRILPGTPATFWVRYLAHTIDSLFVPLASFLVTSNPKLLMCQWGLNIVCTIALFTFPESMRPMFIGLLVLSTNWFYWVGHESSSLKSTLGKESFGLLVENYDEKPMTIKQATYKWFLRVMFIIDGGFPFLGVAFHPEKRALHDIMTGTRVVWKGDK